MFPINKTYLKLSIEFSQQEKKKKDLAQHGKARKQHTV
jgi:hypothetical protein